MSHALKLLILLMIRSFSCSNIFDNGQQKFEEILSLSKASSCWHRVLTMLHKYCSIDEIDKYQSTIAYQFTLCHLSTMYNDLPDISCHQKNIELCVANLHEHMNAFIGK